MIAYIALFSALLTRFSTGLPVESEEISLCVAVECRWMHMDRERGRREGGGGGEREYERSRQEKEARVGWVIRQIQIGVIV